MHCFYVIVINYCGCSGECGELGRHAPPMKIKINGEMEYDTPNILQCHLTPGHMYIATDSGGGSSSSNGGATGTSGVGVNRDASILKAVCNVKSFGCGAYHSMVVVVGDFVYCCGLNNYGQLGLGNSDTTSRDYLTEVPALQGRGIVALRGGMHHSLVLSSSGKLLAFGRSDSGQIGSSKAKSKAAGDFSGIPVSLLILTIFVFLFSCIDVTPLLYVRYLRYLFYFLLCVSAFIHVCMFGEIH